MEPTQIPEKSKTSNGSIYFYLSKELEDCFTPSTSIKLSIANVLEFYCHLTECNGLIMFCGRREEIISVQCLSVITHRKRFQ